MRMRQIKLWTFFICATILFGASTAINGATFAPSDPSFPTEPAGRDPASVRPEDSPAERELIRICQDVLPDDLWDRIEAVDREPDGLFATLLMTTPEADALVLRGIPLERQNLADYLARFAPVTTLERKTSLKSFDAVRNRIVPPPIKRHPFGESDPCTNSSLIHLTYDEYHDLADGQCFLENLASAYPEITRWVDLTQRYGIEPTADGRHLYALKITDHPTQEESNEEKILFTGVTHAREWVTHEMMLYLAEYLTTRYSFDPEVQRIVDHSEVWLVPVVNQDGFEYSWSTDRLWRKNRRPLPDNQFGVDINRNYDSQWGHDDRGSSGKISSETYRGPSAASEPEARVIQHLLTDERFSIAISYHSYSQMVVYPWCYTTYILPQSYTSLRALGKKYAKLAQHVDGKDYVTGQGSYALYLTNGCFEDYAYGVAGALAMTVEMRPRTSDEGGFLLPEDEILPAIEENLVGALWLMANVAGATEITDSDSVASLPDGNGSVFFSLPLTPAHQNPSDSLGVPSSSLDHLTAWMDDFLHRPPIWPRWGEWPEEFEGVGCGRGYFIESDGIPSQWVSALTSCRVLPYVFEDGAEVPLSNYQGDPNHPALNVIGIPSRLPVLMRDIRVIKRRLKPIGQSSNGERESILDVRTAIEDMHANKPWIDWTWESMDDTGSPVYSNPSGIGGTSLTVEPFRAYFVHANVPSWNFGSTSSHNAMYLLKFPPSIAFDFPDCNHNGVSDTSDLADGLSPDDNHNGIPDECE